MARSAVSVVGDTVSAGRVFTEPVDRDGTTVIGVARVYGGGGGERLAGGVGLLARPVGAYVMKDGRVRWVPAVDVNRLLALLLVLMVVVLVRRARHRRRQAEES